jgi:TRAP transporter 4TM/12TM fusion protein
MSRIARYLHVVFIVLLPLVGVAWVLRLGEPLGIPLITPQVIAIMLGLASGAAFLRFPYLRQVTLLDIALAVAVSASWFWYAWNFDSWMLLLAYRTPDMWVPGLVAIVLMLEALRKSVGLTIAILVWTIVAYGFFGDHIPGLFRAEVFSPTKTILYLYADSSGIPGLVVTVIINVVLPFVIFGKVMEIAGGMTFFNNMALAMMGKRRGGPAKVAVVASASFGTLSGSTVANIMSTGILTIPLMKRTGFRPEQAAAIEAVASNGGQIMPPVMGATAFIIAEFLQIPYSQVVLASLAPALLYYLVLFFKIDAIAVKENIAGLPASEIPSALQTLKEGWFFVLPLGYLIYLLLWRGYDPGLAALQSTGILIVCYLLQHRLRPEWEKLWALVRGAGQEIVPLILIGGGAGAVIGIMNSTGFAFQLSLVLTHVASEFGLFSMLVLAAIVSIVLGMGMPTAAVYVVLVTVVAPSVINFGVDPLAAHLFLFYFGLMSMITPPIAVGSIVAAQIAGANMWSTSFYGMRMGISAYLLPFLWIYNPAILLHGSTLEIAIVLSNCLAAAVFLRLSMMPVLWRVLPAWASGTLMTLAAVVVGSASIWLGPSNPAAFVPSLLGLGAVLFEHMRRPLQPRTA